MLHRPNLCTSVVSSRTYPETWKFYSLHITKYIRARTHARTHAQKYRIYLYHLIMNKNNEEEGGEEGRERGQEGREEGHEGGREGEGGEGEGLK